MGEVDESHPWTDTLRQVNDAVGDVTRDLALRLFNSIRKPSDKRPASSPAKTAEKIAHEKTFVALEPIAPKARSGESPETARDPDVHEDRKGNPVKDVKAPLLPPQLAAESADQAWDDFEKALSDAVDKIARDAAKRDGAPLKRGTGLSVDAAEELLAQEIAGRIRKELIPGLRARLRKVFVNRWRAAGAQPIPGAQRPQPAQPPRGMQAPQPQPKPLPEGPGSAMKGKGAIKHGKPPGGR